MRWEDGYECISDALLVAISAIVLRDQAPELAIQPIELRIRGVEYGLDMIEEPGAQVFEVTRTAQVGASQCFELMLERRHGASF